MRDEMLGAEILDADFAPSREAMPPRHDKRQLIAIHHDRLQIRVGRLIGDDAEVGAVVAHLRGNAAGQAAADREAHRRMQPPVVVQQRQQVQAGQLVARR